MEVSEEEKENMMEITGSLHQTSDHSISTFLDENTSITTTGFIAKNISLVPSFALDRKECSSFSEKSENDSSETSVNMIMSTRLQKSFCASPQQKNKTKTNFFKNKNRFSKTDKLGLQKMQDALNQSTDTDESLIQFRSKTVSVFRKSRSKTARDPRASDFQSAFDSSADSINKSKMSVSINLTDDSIMSSVPGKKQRNAFLTKKKPSMEKKSSQLDFQNAFNSSADDSQIQPLSSKRLNSDDSSNENVNKRRNSGFCRTSSKTASKPRASEFQSAFNSSIDSVNKSKMSPPMNLNDDSIMLSIPDKKSGFATKRKVSTKKNSCQLDFQNAFNSTNDDSQTQSPSNKRLNADESLIETVNKKYDSGFCKTGGDSEKESDPADNQKAFSTSATSEQLSSKRSSTLNYDVSLKNEGGVIENEESDPADNQKAFSSSATSEQLSPKRSSTLNYDVSLKNGGGVIENEESDPADNKKAFSSSATSEQLSPKSSSTLNYDVSLKNGDGVIENEQPCCNELGNNGDRKDNRNKSTSEHIITEQDENFCSKEAENNCNSSSNDEHLSNKLVNENPCEQKENDCRENVVNVSLKGINDGRSLRKDESSHISGAECDDETDKTLKHVEDSFGTNNVNNSPATLINPKIGDLDMVSRSYISNISVEQNSLKFPENDSIHESKELGIGKPDSVSSLVLRLDDYDSMESDSESEGESNEEENVGNNNEEIDKVAISHIGSSETNRSLHLDSIPNTPSLRRSSRRTGNKDYSSSREKNGLQSENSIENSKSKKIRKINSVAKNCASTSDSFEGNVALRSWIGSKSNSQQSVVRTDINENFNSMEITDGTINDQSSLNVANNSKDKSVFKVPAIDLSWRNRSSRSQPQKNKSFTASQNGSAEKSYVSFQNASMGNDSVFSKNCSRTNKRKTSVPSKRSKRRSSGEGSSVSSDSKSETPSFGSIERRLCIPFSELKKKSNNMNIKRSNDSIVNKVMCFDYGKQPEIIHNEDSMISKSKSFKLKKPCRWISDYLYNYLVSKLKPNYDLKAERRAEKFVEYLCDKYTVVVKEKLEFKKYVEELILEMAKLRLINNLYDFYDFVESYLPHDFYEKSVPGISPFGKPATVQLPPHGTIFDNIL